MTTWTTFANLTAPTLPELDANFLITSSLVNIPCTVAGTNALTLTSAANMATIPAYQNGMQLVGVASATNTTATTAALGSLGALNVYKDTANGPQALTGGEIVQNCGFVLTYDLALNSGSGGFHLSTGGAALTGQSVSVASLQIGSGSLLAPILRVQSSLMTVSFSVLPASSTQDVIISFVGCEVNDNVMVGLPSAIASGMICNAFVLAAGSIAVRMANPTTVSVTPPTSIYRISTMGYT